MNFYYHNYLFFSLFVLPSITETQHHLLVENCNSQVFLTHKRSNPNSEISTGMSMSILELIDFIFTCQKYFKQVQI